MKLTKQQIESVRNQLSVEPVEDDHPVQKELEEAFGQEHETTYGHRAGPEEPVELVNILLVGHGIPDQPRGPSQVAPPVMETSASAASRQAYFGPEAGWIDTPVLRRGDLATARSGPCIIEEYDATCVVPPNWTAALDDDGNIILTREGT